MKHTHKQSLVAIAQSNRTANLLLAVEKDLDVSATVAQTETNIFELAYNSSLKQKYDLRMHCTKTGQELEPFNSLTFAKLLETLGEARTLAILARKRQHLIADWWLDTSPETLDRLMVTDPCGYFAYGYFIIFGKKFINENKARQEIDFQNFRKQIFEKAQEFYAFHPAEIHKANNAIRKFVSVCSNAWLSQISGLDEFHSNIQDWNEIEDLKAFRNGIRLTLENLFKHAEQKGWLKCYQVDYASLKALRGKFGGKTNFAMQKGNKPNDVYNQIADEIALSFGMQSSLKQKISQNKIEDAAQKKGAKPKKRTLGFKLPKNYVQEGE